jgi:hypothetical protein
MALESDVRRGMFGGARLDDISSSFSMVSGARGKQLSRHFCRGTSQPRERRDGTAKTNFVRRGAGGERRQ